MPETTKDQMRAVKWKNEPFSMSVEKVDIPTLQDPLDAIVRLTSSAICGTDLHTYHNRVKTNSGLTMGHENIGIVTVIGSQVATIKVGDRVVVNAFENRVVPNGGTQTIQIFGAGDYGLGSSQVDGGQAEYMRVHFSDDNLLVLPKGKGNELDYLLLADIFPTSWFCLDAAGQGAGETVVVFGAGPAGLLVAYSALLRGAIRVYSVDRVPQRLEMAKKIGAIPIDFSKGEADVQIMSLEPNGVDRACDCVGYECVDAYGQNVRNLVLSQAVRVTRINGGIGLIGVQSPKDLGKGTDDEKKGIIPFPIGEFFGKNLSMKGGPAIIRPYQELLRRMIESGKAKPSFVFSKSYDIREAQVAYRDFSEQKIIKAVFRFD
ncbi:hypothetical protein HYFRA_00012379 [Hymenoscyphus fraxineus]|uniref:Alcohol dehydrogenase n=1 Tax=Hymenoscyphus fraxineus TaxID=746836 RepID=A0A9N9PYE6_9HELO|nr:hypothetical protein HYFRA_00012379 [Hymenoscyphus fraxineus]